MLVPVAVTVLNSAAVAIIEDELLATADPGSATLLALVADALLVG